MRLASLLRPFAALTVLAAIITAGAPAIARQNVQAGVQYPAGTEVFFPPFGVTLTVPAGWIGYLPPGAEIFVIGHKTRPGAAFVLHAGSSLQEAAAVMAGPLPLDGATVLQPEGPVVSITPGVLQNSYSVDSPQGQGRAAGFVKMGDTGLGVGILTVFPADKYEDAEALGRTVLKSLRFERPAIPAAPDGRPWTEVLAGRKIVYLHTGSSSRDSRTIRFCRDGSFSRSGSSGSTGGLGGLTQASSARGMWTVGGSSAAPVLTLSESDGATSYALSLIDNRVHLDGKRFLNDGVSGC